MKPSTIECREGERRRGQRTTRVVLIAFAILEALVIFGAVVPALLEESPSERPPAPTTGASHDRPSFP